MLQIIFSVLGGMLAGFLLTYFVGMELRLLRPRVNDGTLKIDESNPEDVKMKLEFDISMEEMVERQNLYLKIERRK